MWEGKTIDQFKVVLTYRKYISLSKGNQSPVMRFDMMVMNTVEYGIIYHVIFCCIYF